MSETLYQMGTSHQTASSPGQDDLWASLLGSVAASTNKILPTRSLIVLGKVRVQCLTCHSSVERR